MLRALKLKVGQFLQWQATLGARAAFDERDPERRLERIGRLAAEQTEFTREMAASTRRAHSELRGAQDELLRRLADVERSVAALRARAEGMRVPFAFLGEHLGLATVATGHRLFIDTRDQQIAPHLASVGVWESWNERLIRRLLGPGDTVVDVGSNVGYFVTLEAGLVGEGGHVFAFEANQAIARLLGASVEINGFSSRVTVSTTAAADARGTSRFTTYPRHHGAGTLQPQPGAFDADAVVTEVATDTLDAMVPRDDIRLLHLDIEGGEPAALRGAARLIQRSPRLVIVTEWNHVLGAGGDELRWLVGLGFRLHHIRHTDAPRPVSVDEVAGLGLCDLLCCRGTLAGLGLE